MATITVAAIDKPIQLVSLVDANGVSINPGAPGALPSTAIAVIAGSANMANAAAVATMPAVAAKTNYLAGFEITGSGATAALPVAVTITGLLGGTRTYIYNFVIGATTGNTPLIVAFNPPLPASAVNTAIVVTCPASGAGGTNNCTVAHGYVV